MKGVGWRREVLAVAGARLAGASPADLPWDFSMFSSDGGELGLSCSESVLEVLFPLKE